jgi:hypothetical protein
MGAQKAGGQGAAPGGAPPQFAPMTPASPGISSTMADTFRPAPQAAAGVPMAQRLQMLGGLGGAQAPAPQPNMPQPGMPQPNMPQPGMPQPGMPQPGMPMAQANPQPQAPAAMQANPQLLALIQRLRGQGFIRR